MGRVVLLLVWVVALSGCLKAPKGLPPCDSWGANDSICNLMNPEDLAYLPNEGWVLVSEMHMADQNADLAEVPFVPGRLTAIRTSEETGRIEHRKLFPREWKEAVPDSSRWGDPECHGPPTKENFQPHGVDVGIGPDGAAALAVVTHGRREVIDLFEIAFGSDPSLEWRGCVRMVEQAMANDVALLTDGSFIVTKMIPRVESVGFKAGWNVMKMSMGFSTGSVFHWSPEQGWVELANSRGSGPNGLAVSKDGRAVYVAEWGGESVYRLQFAEGLKPGAIPERDAVEIDGSPDNLTWTRDGRLLVTAQQVGPVGALNCGKIQSGGCDIGYSISAIDPETMVATPIVTGRGAASVALDMGEEIWVGYFTGDSLTRLPVGDSTAPTSGGE